MAFCVWIAPVSIHTTNFFIHQYRLSVSRVLILSHEIFFEIYILRFLLQYHFSISSASVSLCCNYSFLYNFLFIHPEEPVGAPEKKATWIFGSNRPLVFRKNSCSQNFWKRSSKTSTMESFLSIFVGISRSFPEQLSCKERVSTCFCKNRLHRRRYFSNFRQSESTQDLKL